MHLRTSLRVLALAVFAAANALAQQAAPAPAAPAAPAPVAAPREEFTPQQKAAMKEAERMRLEKSRIDAELALAEAKRSEELAPLQAEVARLTAERALRLAKASAEAAALEDERAKLERQAALEAARSGARLTERSNKIRELEAEAKQLQLEAANTIARLSNEIQRFQKEDEARKIASKAKPKYLKDPLVDGVLYISDRRIAFNGAVTVNGGTLAASGDNAFSSVSLTAGALTLSGTNTYATGLAITGGTLNLNSVGALGGGTLAISGGTLNNSSASDKVLSGVGAGTIAGSFTFTGDKNLTIGTSSLVLSNTPTINVAGGLTAGPTLRRTIELAGAATKGKGAPDAAFFAAIAEGSTQVRIGTALYGAR